MTDLSRRTALRTVGLTALGLVPLAGCTGGSESGGDGGSGDSDSGGDGGSGDSDSGSSGSGGATGGSDDSGSSSGSGAVPSEVQSYLSDVGNYSGVVDETGSDSVTVIVGSEANGGNFGFDPAAVRVSTGTTVTWEWNGKGGSHNVVAEDGSFESELVAEEGHTFSHTFEEAGSTTYFCQPHKSLGMKGAIVVE